MFIHLTGWIILTQSFDIQTYCTLLIVHHQQIERLYGSLRGQLAFTCFLFSVVAQISCSLSGRCQKDLHWTGKVKVTDAVRLGPAGAVSLLKGHDLIFISRGVDMLVSEASDPQGYNPNGVCRPRTDVFTVS